MAWSMRKGGKGGFGEIGIFGIQVIERYVQLVIKSPQFRLRLAKQSNPGSHRFEFSDKKGEFSCRIFQNQENFGF
jgi:hypothetical protein